MTIQRVRGKKAKVFDLPLDKNGNLTVPYDANGKPDYGRVLRHYRKVVIGWSAEQLATMYCESLKLQVDSCEGEGEEQDITARWIQLMEQKNRVPTNLKRRWVLATLLNVPPALFGLEALEYETLQYKDSVALFSSEKASIDIDEYKNALMSYWELHYTDTTYNLVFDIKHRIEQIQNAILYVRQPQKDAMMRLLSAYHILMGEIVRDLGHYSSAITELNNAILIAQENEYYTLHAAALHLRGNAYLNRWEASGKSDGRSDLISALHNYDAAYQLNTHISSQLQGTIAILRGLVYAHMVQCDSDRRKALKLIGIGGSIARQGHVEDDELVVVKLSELMYHNEKGSALIAVGWPIEAFRELSSEEHVSKTQRRRIYNTILQANTYLNQGFYPIATSVARDALAAVKNIKSGLNLARISNIYKSLKASPYGKSVEVAQLGVELMKVKQPQLYI